MASVYVDKIAYRTESEERDACRENNIESIKPCICYVGECVEQQIEILEIHKHADVDTHIQGNYASAQPVRLHTPEPESEQIIGQTHSEQDKAAFSTRLIVEIKREQYYEHLA